MITKQEAREQASYSFGVLMGICLALDLKIVFDLLATLRASLIKAIETSDLSEK